MMLPEKSELNQLRQSNLSQETVIEELKQAFTYDFLNVDEFETRLEKATATRDQAELQSLIADLPLKEQQPAPAARISRQQVKENDILFSIMGGITKKGNWKPPRHLTVVAVMGGIDLDFTRVEFPPGETEVKVFTMMGGADIIVPPGINVDANGFAIMGGYDNHTVQDREYPGAPTLKIRSFSLMGGVEIRPPRQKLLERILKKFHLM